MRFFPNKPWYFQSFFEIICSVLLVWLHLKLGLGLQICKIMPNDWLLLHGLCNLVTWKGDANVPFSSLFTMIVTVYQKYFLTLRYDFIRPLSYWNFRWMLSQVTTWIDKPRLRRQLFYHSSFITCFENHVLNYKGLNLRQCFGNSNSQKNRFPCLSKFSLALNLHYVQTASLESITGEFG